MIDADIIYPVGDRRKHIKAKTILNTNREINYRD
jgi:hypothetical protein